MSAVLSRVARVHAHSPAVLVDSRSVTWAQFGDRVARLAAGLHGLGVHCGDRVAVLAPNHHQFLELQYAVFWAGAILVPLNYRFAQAEMTQVIADTDAVLLVADPDFSSQARLIAGQRPELKILWFGDEAAQDHFEQLASIDPIADQSGRSPGGIAGIYFTGGTTGRPRGVALTHGNFLVQALEMHQVLGAGPGDAFLHAIPLFHLADAGVGHGITASGAAHCFLRNFAPAACLDQIARHRVRSVDLVPTMITLLLDEVEKRDPADSAQATSSLDTIIYGGSPVPAALLERLGRVLPFVGLRQFYGMTELCGACATLSPEDHRATNERAGGAGRSFVSTAIDIRRPDGSSGAPGERGEVVVSGPMVMNGYWRNPEATAAAIRDGWMHTGDVGSIDADGYLTVHDRLKDMIISGGENVYSAEVEAAITIHPGVAACAVIGVPDPRWGERVHAVVVVADAVGPVRSGALSDHCRGLIAGYKIPRSWDIGTSPLPLTGVGKVNKVALRDRPIDTA